MGELAKLAPELLALIEGGADYKTLMGAAEGLGADEKTLDLLAKKGTVDNIGEFLKPLTGGENIVENYKKLMDPKYHYENTLPSAIAVGGGIESAFHPDETFGTGTYKNLYDYMEGTSPTDSKERSVFKDDSVISPAKPYGRARVNAQKIDNSPAGQIKQIAQMMPKYNMAQVEVTLRNIVMSDVSQQEKISQASNLLSQIQKDLEPVALKLQQLGFKLDGSK
jgi:hypothetical protein